MTKEKIAQLKETMLQERNKILGQKATKDMVDEIGISGRESGDIVDIASKQYQTDFFLQLADHEKETIRLIDAALKKIDGEGFGICEGTGKVIEEARLEAIPWTPYCFEYAKQISKKR